MKGESLSRELFTIKIELEKSDYRSPNYLKALRKRARRIKQELKNIAAHHAEVFKTQFKLL